MIHYTSAKLAILMLRVVLANNSMSLLFVDHMHVVYVVLLLCHVCVEHCMPNNNNHWICIVLYGCNSVVAGSRWDLR